MPADRLREAPGAANVTCAAPGGAACQHGTFVASILAADRDAGAPGICPGCSFLARPIFPEAPSTGSMPSATPEALATAIVDCISAGARILNLSLAVTSASVAEERQLVLALDAAAARGVLVVAAAGNHGTVGSSAITRHPWVRSAASNPASRRSAWRRSWRRWSAARRPRA